MTKMIIPNKSLFGAAKRWIHSLRLVLVLGGCLFSLPHLQAQLSSVGNEGVSESEAVSELIDQLRRKADTIQYRDPSRAMRLAKEALQLAISQNDPAEEGLTRALIGKYFVAGAEYDSARIYFDRADELARISGNDTIRAWVINQIVIFQIRVGETEEARKLCEEGLEIARRMGDIAGAGNLCNQMGATYHYLGDPYRAMDWYQYGLTLFKHSGNALGIASSYSNLGIVYSMQGNDEHVLEYMLAGKAVVEKKKDTTMLLTSLINVGSAHAQLGQDSLALVAFEECLALAEKVQQPSKIALALANIGRHHLQQFDFGKARESLEKSYHIYDEIGNQRGIASSGVSLAKIYLEEGEPKKALPLLQNAHEWAMTNQERKVQQRACEIMVAIHEALGNPVEALKCHREFKAVSDSLVNAETIRMATLDASKTEYELEKSLAEEGRKRETELREAQTKQERIWKYIFICAAGALLIYALAVIGYYRALKRRTKIISEQRDKIAYLNSNLEKLVRERTRELKIKTEQLSEYIFTNSHRVRGPLARILGLVGVWRANGFSTMEEYEQMFEFIDRSAKEADRVIYEISDKLEQEG